MQARGAHPTVIWADMPSRPNVIWPDIPTPETAWKIPPIVKAAMKGADLLINHISDLSSEEHLKEFPELLKELKLPMVRNMATTTGLIISSWARTPHDLIAEIRYRMAELIKPDETWSLSHPNGTHLEGTVGSPGRGGEAYAYWRRDGYYRPFPDGIYPAVNPVGTNGIYVFEQMMPVWAKEIGVPVRFSAPVRIAVEDNQMTKIEGGAEATAVRGFREALARRVGERRTRSKSGDRTAACIRTRSCRPRSARMRTIVNSSPRSTPVRCTCTSGRRARVLRFRSICTRRRKRAARRSRSAAACCMTAGGSRSPTIRA